MQRRIDDGAEHRAPKWQWHHPRDALTHEVKRCGHVDLGLWDNHQRHRRRGQQQGEVVVGEGHTEHRVHLVEIDLRKVYQLVPEPHRVGVTGLERDHPRPGAHVEVAGATGGLRLLGGVELDPRALVEHVRVGDEQPGLGRSFAHLEQVLDEHAERGAPVADVVLPDDVVAEVLERAGQRVADDRRAQVPDVHLLGHVG